jgi:hypothetical protein
VSDLDSDDLGVEEAVPVDWLPRGVFLLDEERRMMDERGFEDEADVLDIVSAATERASERRSSSRSARDGRNRWSISNL